MKYNNESYKRIVFAVISIIILSVIIFTDKNYANANVIANDVRNEVTLNKESSDAQEFFDYEDDDFYPLDRKIELTHLYPTEVVFYKDGTKSSRHENVAYHIDGDKFIIQIPYSVSKSQLKNANVEATIPDGECFFSLSGNSINLTEDTTLTVSMNDGRYEVYNVKTEYLTGDMPVLYVTTDDGAGVNSRTEYTTGKLVIDGREYTIEIRGRGNVSWWGYDQHGYMLKFDETISLCGLSKSDKFCVLSTYGDTSLVRNLVVMNMATCMDNLEYVPKQKPVDMFIDGEYYGVFTLSEKIDVASDKVNLFSDYGYEESLTAYSDDDPYDDLAFMIEMGGYSKESYAYGIDHFSTSHIHDAFIKYPFEETLDYEKSERIKAYLRNIDQLITVRNAQYVDYIEMEDWVDWFIVMEYSNSTDSAFQRSTYLYKRPGGKLFVGPIWDFDKALGNYGMDNPKYDTWCSAESDYAVYQNNLIHYLYQSDIFMEMVKERWDEKKDLMKELALDALDDAADDIAFSRVYNDRLYQKPGANKISQIANFLTTRYNWIDKSIHSYNYNRHPNRPTITFNNNEG